MWIELMNSLVSSVIQEGCRYRPSRYKHKDSISNGSYKRFYMKTGLTLASKIASSTSCALFWVKWCWLGMWGRGVRPDTEYDLAKQLNSETVKK